MVKKMALVSNESIKKAVKQMFAIFKQTKTERSNPDQYLNSLRYAEGPTVWNQKWKMSSYRKRA